MGFLGAQHLRPGGLGPERDVVGWIGGAEKVTRGSLGIGRCAAVAGMQRTRSHLGGRQ